MRTNAKHGSYVASVAAPVPLLQDISINDVPHGSDGEEELAELVAFFSEEGSVNDLCTPTPKSRGDGSVTRDDCTQRGVADATSGGVCLKSVRNCGASAKNVAWSRENDIHPDLFESALNIDAYIPLADADWQHCSWKTFGDLHPSLSLDETFDWDFAEFAPAHTRLLVCAVQEAVAPENKAEDAEAGDAEMVEAAKAGAGMMGDAAKAGAEIMGDAVLNASTDKKILTTSSPTARPTSSGFFADHGVSLRESSEFSGMAQPLNMDDCADSGDGSDAPGDRDDGKSAAKPVVIDLTADSEDDDESNYIYTDATGKLFSRKRKAFF